MTTPGEPEFFRCVLTFTKTQDTLDAFEETRKRFPDAHIIPVPNAVSESCGLAIELPEWQPEEQYAYFKTLPMKAYLYKLTLKKDARGVSKILKAEQVL
ncbi:MAG: putative Se/S carrier-like protein [Pyramidobacter sp.]|jgi:hypothetical protein